LLAAVVSKEILETKLQSTGDMKHIQGAAPQCRRVPPAEIASPMKSSTLRQIGLNVRWALPGGFM
jgi:hypothetical protein